MKSLLFVLGTVASMVGMGTVRAEDNVPTAAEKLDGFVPMFDGTFANFNANWVTYKKGDTTNTDLDATQWKVNAPQCGTAKCIALPSGNSADIRSVKKFKDFELRWTYRIDGNQGVFYRSLVTYDRAWLTGVEYAINNVTNLLKDNPGAAYDLYAPPDPVPYYNFSTSKWNTARIVVKGDSVEHWSNEKKVVGYRYHSKDFWTQYNTSKWVGTGPRTLTNIVAGTQDVGTGYIPEGYLGLQADHGGKWQIKDLKVSTKPCFDTINEYGSSCGTVPPSSIGQTATRPGITMEMAQVSGHVTLTFPEVIKTAQLVSLDGKVMSEASIGEEGHKASFSQALKTGMYFVRIGMASGVVTQKLNVL